MINGGVGSYTSFLPALLKLREVVSVTDYPLYPRLNEQGEREAQLLLDQFKKRLTGVAKEVIDDLYTDIAVYIESDSWTNFRNQLMDGFKNYNNRKIQGEYDFKQIREQIYRDFKDEIVKDLNQDNLEEIEKLKSEINRLQEAFDRMQRRGL